MTSDTGAVEGEETAPSPPTPAELLEAELMKSAGSILEAAATDIPFEDARPPAVSDRLEDRKEIEADQEDEPDAVVEDDSQWQKQPSIRQQALQHPDTVKYIDPETKILNLGDPAQLAEYNRIQRESDDPETRTLLLTEAERQVYNGTWVVLVTFSQVRYLRM